MSRTYCTKGHQPGPHDASCLPAAEPGNQELRLLRAVFGLCPDCDRAGPHRVLCRRGLGWLHRSRRLALAGDTLVFLAEGGSRIRFPVAPGRVRFTRHGYRVTLTRAACRRPRAGRGGGPP